MPIRTQSRSAKGMRRGGVFHTPEPQTFPDDQFTEEQMDQLLAEPGLLVEVLDAEPAKGEAEGAKPEKGKAEAAKGSARKGEPKPEPKADAEGEAKTDTPSAEK